MEKYKKYIDYGLIICFFLIILLVGVKSLYKGTSALASSPYLPEENPLGEGVDNVFLFDTSTSRTLKSDCIKDSNGNCLKDDDGEYIKDYTYSYSYDSSYVNLLNYVDYNGNITNNKFMDTFIVASCKSRLKDRMDIVTEINNKIGEINVNNNLDIKLNIIMGVCIGTGSADARFGNGYGDTYNLGEVGSKNTYTGDRYIYPEYSYYTSIYQMVSDITHKFYTESNDKVTSNFDNVKLVGFYWMPESIGYGSNDVSWVKYFNDLVQGKRSEKQWLQKYNFKSLWIPYMTGQNRYSGSWELSWDSNNSNYVDAFGMCDTYGKMSDNSYINPACASLGISHTTSRADADAYTTVNGWRFYGDELYMYGYNYGFNFVSIQTNYPFHGNNARWNSYRGGNENANISRLDFDDYVLKKTKGGVEFELDPDSSHNGSYFGYNGCTWYKTWLTYALQKEWYNTVNVYYIYNMFNPVFLNQNGIARDYYDSTYKYATRSLTQSDIDKISCERGYYSGNAGYRNYINVSNGKSYDTDAENYTAAPSSNSNGIEEYGYYVADTNGNGGNAWTTDNQRYCSFGNTFTETISGVSKKRWKSNLYCDDGAKLTDGVFGKSSFSTFDEWTVFSASKHDNNPYYYINVDLGTDTKSLTYFGIELDNHKTGGLVTIGESESIVNGSLANSVVKGSIKVYVSDTKDGTYTEVGKLSLMENRNIIEAAYYELKLDPNEAVSGRYVKFVIDYRDSGWKDKNNKYKGFIFVSETIVGRTSTIRPSSNKTVINAGVGDPASTQSSTVNLTLNNIVMDNLTVTSTDSNVATVSKVSDGIKITAVGRGTAKINIKDKLYGATVTHDVEVLGRYKISFNGNGGSINGLSSIYATYESNHFYQSTSDINPSSDIVPTASKSSSTFLGWYTSNNGGVKVFNANGTLISNVEGYTNSNGKWIKKDDVTLYAYYETNTVYSLIYNCSINGGNGDSTVQYEEGKTVDLTKTCIKNGYTFVGWNTDKNATNKIDSYVMPGNNSTIYGIFKKAAVTLKARFNGNGGTLSSDEDKTCTIGAVYNNNEQATTCVVDVPTFSKTGYTFVGWNINNEATENNSAYSASNNKLTLNVNDDIGDGRIWYAISKANRYKITFNASPGIINGNNKVYVEYNSNKIYQAIDSNTEVIFPKATLDGYIFMGWTISGNVLGDENGNVLENVSGYIEDGKWIITSDIVLYPRWGKIVTVTFHKNGNKSQTTSAGIASTNETVTRTCIITGGATSCKIKAPIMEAAEGFTIDGYSAGANVYSDYWEHNTEKSFSEDEDWYAQSTKTAIDGKVTFNLNGNKGFTYNEIKYYETVSIKICKIEAVHNGTDQATSCKANITLPTIEVTNNTPKVIGWSNDVNNHTALYNSGQTNVELKSGVILYAQSTKSEETLKARFNGNGGTLSSDEDKTCTIGAVYNNNEQATTCVVDVPTFSKTGYTFVGWNINNEATENNSAYSASNNKLTLNVNDDIGDGRIWYAISKANRYKITFNAVDGSLSGSEMLYIEYNSNKIYQTEFGDDYGVLPTVSRDGYELTGWYTASGEKLFNIDGSVNSNVSGYTSNDGKFVINENIVLYAHFESVQDDPFVDTFEFNEKANYDVDNEILAHIAPGVDSVGLFNTIDTNGVLSIFDKDGIKLTENIKLRTGYKLRATFTTKVLEYKISVKGDVLGTGELSSDNAKEIAKHVIKKNTIVGEEYLLAADYNNDGKIKMNDVVKMLKDKSRLGNY